jgi:hypothetical protein
MFTKKELKFLSCSLKHAELHAQYDTRIAERRTMLYSMAIDCDFSVAVAKRISSGVGVADAKIPEEKRWMYDALLEGIKEDLCAKFKLENV